MMQGPKPEFGGAGAAAVSRVEAALDRHLARSDLVQHAAELQATCDPEVAAQLEAVLSAALSYRDVLLIQLAWGLSEHDFDHTKPPRGARPASSQLTKLLRQRHINARMEVYQTLAKGNRSGSLMAGNVPAFDALLLRLNSDSLQNRKALFQLLTARMAEMARPVRPMPELARVKLTFVAVATFLDDLLKTGSGGAYEQFAVAAFLSALIDEFGLSGGGGLRVDTKNINASDASAKTAADIQVMRGGRVEEAFEVSASGWSLKVHQAIAAARNTELTRAHVLAYGDDLAGLAEHLGDTTTDVAVMDVRNFLRLMVAIMKKPAREDALVKMYDFIDQKQTDIEKTNRFVAELGRHALTA